MLGKCISGIAWKCPPTGGSLRIGAYYDARSFNSRKQDCPGLEVFRCAVVRKIRRGFSGLSSTQHPRRLRNLSFAVGVFTLDCYAMNKGTLTLLCARRCTTEYIPNHDHTDRNIFVPLSMQTFWEFGANRITGKELCRRVSDPNNS